MPAPDLVIAAVVEPMLAAIRLFALALTPVRVSVVPPVIENEARVEAKVRPPVLSLWKLCVALSEMPRLALENVWVFAPELTIPELPMVSTRPEALPVNVQAAVPLEKLRPPIVLLALRDGLKLAVPAAKLPMSVVPGATPPDQLPLALKSTAVLPQTIVAALAKLAEKNKVATAATSSVGKEVFEDELADRSEEHTSELQSH
mgnify:CR=1 FL=1